MHPSNHVIEISEIDYRHLMHDLTLAGINTPASHGSGFSGTHPDFGDIIVARVDRRPRRHALPPHKFILKAPSGEALSRVTAAMATRTPAPKPSGSGLGQ